MISIDPVAGRSYHYRHTFVPNVRPGQIYGYRVYGPFDPPSGMRFDPTKVLLDLYGRAVVISEDYSPLLRINSDRRCAHPISF